MQWYLWKWTNSWLSFPKAVLKCYLFNGRQSVFYARHFSIFSNLQKNTAGIIIIGDEILKGQTQDSNSFFLLKKLNKLGIKVHKIVVIPDEAELIAQEILQQSLKYTVVITSGGIGPTHDDVTYEAVAKAFGEQLSFNSTLVDFCKEYFGCAFNPELPVFKLAQLPSSAVLNFGEDKTTGKRFKFPLVSVKNVYIFPGVPSLMEKSFNIFQDVFKHLHQKLYFDEIFINLDEVSITPALNAAVNKFRGCVTFGSYPTFNHNYYRVRLTMEGEKMEDVKAAYNFLVERLPDDCIVAFEKNAISKAKEEVYHLADSNQKVSVAVRVIEECLRKYKLSEICVSFNGGKDCTALLHLLHACTRHVLHSECKLQALYIRSSATFPQVESFIQSAANEYNLSLHVVEGQLLQAFKHFMASNPQIAAILMGSRRSDPGMDTANHFCMTDGEWPSVMRILPILDWTYKDVWIFLRKLYVPYCPLYDMGYTSLGCKDTSSPNPTLQYIDHRGRICYYPAYKLSTAEQERSGRH